MTALRSVWRFLVDLLVGDDPKVATLVVCVLAACASLVAGGGAAPRFVLVGGATALLGGFALSLATDSRRGG